MEVRIKLPKKATLVGGSYEYDANTHEAVMTCSAFSIWKNITNLQLQFSNMAIGEAIVWPNDAITITGKEGKKLEKTFTLDLSQNAVIEAPELKLNESSRYIRSLIK